jgi:hypothetical protein
MISLALHLASRWPALSRPAWKHNGQSHRLADSACYLLAIGAGTAIRLAGLSLVGQAIMAAKATALGPGNHSKRSRKARQQDAIRDFYATQAVAKAINDPTPGHLVQWLIDGKRLDCSAIPPSDLCEMFDLTCEYCGMAVIILHSMGPALPLVRHPLYFNRHSCPKGTAKPDGTFMRGSGYE